MRKLGQSSRYQAFAMRFAIAPSPSILSGSRLARLSAVRRVSSFVPQPASKVQPAAGQLNPHAHSWVPDASKLTWTATSSKEILYSPEYVRREDATWHWHYVAMESIINKFQYGKYGYFFWHRKDIRLMIKSFLIPTVILVTVLFSLYGGKPNGRDLALQKRIEDAVRP